MSLPNRVNVLLSKFNGEKFLLQQLESLERQSHPVTYITIRDDGSSDGTSQLIAEFAARRSDVRVIRGRQLGVTQSFFELLQSAEENCDYYALCDQDDVWEEKKLQDAVEALGRYSPRESLLYCCAVEYVDSNLNHLGYSRSPRAVSFANALVENVTTGCTIVLNRRAREMITAELPCNPLAHDWWCYLVVSAFGRIIYEPRPNIKYRQHQHNAIGVALKPWEQFKRRLKRFRETGFKFTQQARQFYEHFNTSLNPQHHETLTRFLEVQKGFWPRVAYATRMGVVRQSKLDSAILRLLIILGRA
jgi:glycosyltransferase involved in cell wall biosynthesis